MEQFVPAYFTIVLALFAFGLVREMIKDHLPSLEM